MVYLAIVDYGYDGDKVIWAGLNEFGANEALREFLEKDDWDAYAVRVERWNGDEVELRDRVEL